MEKQYTNGQPVKYVDEFGKAHDALISIWWLGDTCYLSDKGEPGCNLVYVSDDPKKTDSYGIQLERATSVVHKTKQAAAGRYWCWPEEL